MKKKSFIMLTMCIFIFMCTFAVQSYATETEEFSEGSLNYSILDDGTVKITKFHGDEKNYTIPSKIDGKFVSVIGRYSFMHAENLNKLVIPESVREIEDQGIEECYALKTIIINKGKFKNISNTSIENCHKLQSKRQRPRKLLLKSSKKAKSIMLRSEPIRQ